MQDSLNATFGSPDRAHHRRAFRDKAPQGKRLVIRRPHLGQEPRRMELGEDFCVHLVGLYPGMGDRLHLKRVGDHDPGHERRQKADDRRSVPRRLKNDLVIRF